MPYSIDLFVGAGGITEGYTQQGYTSVFANDFDEEAMHTFTYNHPTVPYMLKDIRELMPDEIIRKADISPDEIDIITGGPPCQGFSLAGLRLSDDPRNALFKEYVRIAKSIKPKVVFFENVHGITNMQQGKVLAAILSEFSEIGYNCDCKIVNAADFGVPQARPRFVLIGIRGDRHITFPKPTHGVKEQFGQIDMLNSSIRSYVTVGDALSDLPILDQGEGSEELKHDTEYFNNYQIQRRGTRNPGIIYNHRATKHSAEIQYRYSQIPPGCNNSVLPEEIRTKKHNVFKLEPTRPARTVTCNFRTDLIHPTMNRGLTVREAARLQSFDDDYKFFGNLTRKAKWLTQDDQVGNAVPPLLAKAFAEHIEKKLLTQF